MPTQDNESGLNFLQSPLSRRDFLKMGGLMTISLLSQGIPGIALKSFAQTPAMARASKKLIVIFLRGAIDGLSVLVPYQDADYYAGRKNIAIPKPGVTNGGFALDDRFALNPNLKMLMPLWQSKKLAFVSCSGSPDPTRSHFDAQDFMESGTPGLLGTDTGWMDRFLQIMPTNPSPMRGLNVGTTIPRIYRGPIPVSTISTWMDPLKPISLDNPIVASSFRTMYEKDPMLSKTYELGLASRASMLEAFKAELQESSQGAPVGSEFKKAGGLIARLIKDQPGVQSVFVSLGAWDTHVNQGSSVGTLGGLLGGLGEGLATLMSGLESNGNLANTTILVMSEFGRTVKENGSVGTDHGHGNVMWVMGGAVNGGQVAGSWSGLSQAALYEGRDVPVTTDYRAVVMDLLRAQYGFTADQLKVVFPTAGDVKTAIQSPLFRSA